MNFGDNLKQLRKTKKVSQEELAEKLGVSRQSISKWETGENYPSMTNIMCLCDIFHCKINDIVHEDFEDINSLDPEIKMKVVKLKEKEQKKVKVLSKVLYILALIGKIATRIAAGIVIVIAVLIPVFASDIKYKNNEIRFKNISKDIIRFEEKDKDIIILVNDKKIKDPADQKTLQMVKDVLDNNSITKVTTIVTIGFVLLGVYLFIIAIILSHIEKLFKNINEGQTPFTLENVKHIKKAAYYMIAAIVFSAFGSGIFALISEAGEVEFDSFDLIEILFLFAMAYIFEYGVEIQKDSKGIMYDEQK